MRFLLILVLVISGDALSGGRLSAAPVTSITLDGSLGQPAGNVAASSPHLFTISPATLGKPAFNGANLFESFGNFNLGTGDTASFTANAGTQNIIARVTGGSASTIDGTLSSPVNLVFLNPAGVMFEANAQVNVTGSFVVSTAHYAKLSDGNIFYADTNHAIADAGLTSAPVSAFGFLSATPQPITFTGSQITMQAGTGLHVIGGDITLDQGSPDGVTEQGANLLAPAGDLTLFSAAGAGEVPFSLASPGAGFASATNTAFGQISLRDSSSVAIDGVGGGNMVIRGGRVVLGNSYISSDNSGAIKGGDISIQADQLLVQDGGQIFTATSGSGDSGDISITANSATIGGTNPVLVAGVTGIFSNADAGSTGNAGTVNVTVTGNLSLINTGQISGATFAAGMGGQVNVQADTLTIDGSATPGSIPGIDSDSNPGATGEAGGITVAVTGLLTIAGGGAIGSDSFSDADAGEVNVHAGALAIDGSADPADYTGISSDSTSGNASSPAEAGLVTVDVAAALTIAGGGQISTDTYTAGDAGDVAVQAGSLTINGAASGFTGISSTTNSIHPSSTGDAGTVTVNVSGALSLNGGGLIDVSTNTKGEGGEVTVQASSLSIAGAGSGITGDATARGDGGDVQVDATNVNLASGGTIATSSFESDAGDIQLNVVNLTLQGSSIDTSAGKDGGAINLNVNQLVYLLNSTIISQADGGHSTIGGDINLNPAFVVLNHSLISANDPLGTGGNITITTSDFLSSVSAITATGSTNGAIVITAPDLNLSGSLISLPAALVDEENRLRENCARAVNHEFSSFIVVGRGGTESSPPELQPDFGFNTPPNPGSSR